MQRDNTIAPPEVAIVGIILADNFLACIHKSNNPELGYMAVVELLAYWADEFCKKYEGTDWHMVLGKDNTEFPDCECWDDAIIHYGTLKLKEEFPEVSLARRLVFLQSVQCYFDPETGDTYQIKAGGGVPNVEAEPVNVVDVEIIEWFDQLRKSPLEMAMVEKYLDRVSEDLDKEEKRLTDER